ncbi:MAG: M4 family metallopeptidase [Anaerolineaceae bacterium]|nr:M4 family metallopeptidase [Anaerolineaceae bacterium]
MRPCFHPVECVIPEHMLESIATHGTSAQRQAALNNIRVVYQLRAERAMRASFKGLFDSAIPRAINNEKERVIYDAMRRDVLPGTVARREGDAPSSDPAVNEAYDGGGTTYDLFTKEFGRNSIDNRAMRLDASVHYRTGYDNAFWDGAQMVYGDGDEDLPADERLFNRFTIAIDIIGHELTHGVTQFEAKLVYSQQSGALNEHMSDVFGSLVKQYQLQQSASEADWIIGAGLLTGNVNGVGVRSMKTPGAAYDDPVLGKDPQPAHMRAYVNTVSDNGGVHINSGIPNHAFYLTALEMGGYAWKKAGQIWYTALRDKLSENSSFQQCADLTHQTAGELFGAGSLEQQAVQHGWAAVGLTVSESGGKPKPSGCLEATLRFIGAA